MNTFKPSLRKLIATAAVAAAALVVIPASASAAVSCSLENPGGLLDVTLTGQNSHASVGANSVGEILVREQGPLVACANGPATTANTNLVRVRDLTAGASAQVSMHDMPMLGGDAEADGAAEIELWVELGDGGNDELTFYAAPGANNFRLGDDGINFNVGSGGADREISVMTGIEDLTVFGDDGNDTISAQGGEGTDQPYAPDRTTLRLTGDSGDDQVTGGDSAQGDFLQGGPGNDSVSGAAGNDYIEPYDGDDTVSGGAGTDIASFLIPITPPVNVDLAQTGPQVTGQGVDTIAAEGAIGTSGADTLRGTAGPNLLNGQGGNDTIDGRAGDDELEGSSGDDLVTYAAAPAGVSVDLAAMTATGGFGTDMVSNFEDVTGSAFGDSLVGSAAANKITALAGKDQVSAVGGTDTVDVRDGEADIASCGAELDTATADQRSLDSVSPDCENADFLPEPAGNNGGGGEAGGGGDAGAADGELALELTAKRAQKVAKRGRATVTARCPAEPCSVTATTKLRVAGAKLKLRPASADVAAGEPAKLVLRVKKRQVGTLRDALASAKRAPKLKVAATATDAVGNVATEKVKIAAL